MRRGRGEGFQMVVRGFQMEAVLVWAATATSRACLCTNPELVGICNMIDQLVEYVFFTQLGRYATSCRLPRHAGP